MIVSLRVCSDTFSRTDLLFRPLQRLVSQVRAQISVAEMRDAAREGGLDRLTQDEIQVEIDAVRSKR